MALDTVGILTPIEFALEQPTVLTAVEREVFINERPLFARLPHTPAEAEVYTIVRYDVRARAYAVGTGGITNVATSLPIADASWAQVGDVLEFYDGTNTERVEVTAAPILSTTPNTLTIRRAREGTTAAAFAAAATITLIGNARTGGEIDQQAFRETRATLDQIVQTFQYPVQIGGKSERIRNVALPPGAPSVMGAARAVKLVNAVRDIEYSMYYGIGEKPAASGDRGKMKGLRELIRSYSGGANVVTNAGASYTRTNFITNLMQKVYDSGGNPDVILCSTDFLAGLDVWVPNKTAQMGQGRTEVLGFPIRSFVLPLMGEPLAFVPSLQLRKGTAAVLTSSDLSVKYLGELFWKPREARGDAMEGDWIGDYAIHCDHPQQHGWIEGIQSYA